MREIFLAPVVTLHSDIIINIHQQHNVVQAYILHLTRQLNKQIIFCLRLNDEDKILCKLCHAHGLIVL